jgi:hypothetical protein
MDWDRWFRARLLGGGRAVCPACGTEAVVPVRWHEHDATHWWIRLRCGSCERIEEVTLPDDQARDLDWAVHRGTRAIERTVQQLDRDRMERDAETLAVALTRDLIDAEDFATGSSRWR